MRKFSIKLSETQGDILRNIFKGPGFGALLLVLPGLVFILSLLWQIVPAPAQVATFTYQGPAFDMALCQTWVAGPPSLCRTGSVTGTATIYRYASNYSGSINVNTSGN